jgi:phage gpG-like protein
MYEVSIRTDGNFEKMIQSMGVMTEKVNMAAKDAMLRALNLLRNAIIRSGRVPYKTGTLRRSITYAMEGDQLYNIVGRVGTDLPYAPVHEYGGTWTFHRKSAFGKPTKPYVVTAHYKARRYIGDTFAEQLQDI